MLDKVDRSTYLNVGEHSEAATAIAHQHQLRRCTLSNRWTRICVLVFSSALILGIQHLAYRAHKTEHPAPSNSRVHAPSGPVFDWYALKPSRDIEWTSCYSDQKCARLLLPLDYDIPNGPTTAIALRMIPATDIEKYRGTIFINPGGPGGAGTDLVGRRGKNISRVVGPSFDILGFDPRGTGMSTPAAFCFDSISQRDIWNTQEGHEVLRANDSSLALFHARAKLLAQRCEQRLGGEWGIGRFVSTPNVARDMLEISKKLGQDQLQYWGFSYGSVLGQYFAAIYPDNVKRLVIDGVYDSHNYRATLWNTNIVDIDTVVDALFTFCHRAGPEKCSIWDSSPEKVRGRYFRILDQVAKNPVPIALASPPAMITYKALLSQLFMATYKPIPLAVTAADTIRAIETDNQTALAALAPAIVNPTECKCDAAPDARFTGDNEASFAIMCGDGDVHEWDEDAYREYYAGLEGMSPLMAPMWGIYWLQCAEWTIRPKWRWTGPLEAKNTSHPILVVSTRYDPVTPLSDALRVRVRYGGAGLLIQESYGHCSLSSPSLCTMRHVREYFVNGTIPEEGAVCEVDELPFIGPPSSTELDVLSADDAELLEALKGLSSDMLVYKGL